MDDLKTLQLIHLVAVQFFNGHFTLMRFTTNYRLSFGSQPISRKDISEMVQGKTIYEALINALINLK